LQLPEILKTSLHIDLKGFVKGMVSMSGVISKDITQRSISFWIYSVFFNRSSR